LFKKELQRRFQEIFQMGKSTYNTVSEECPEQDVLFITIEDARCTSGGGKESAIVKGFITVFSQNERLPYGFFEKKILKADNTLTKDLHFHDMDQNAGQIMNLVGRRNHFTFLYQGIYDPNQGHITSIEFPIEESA
jgi:hypothetical protein